MTKLTEMINLKAAVAGAAVLTALPSFLASPAQAISMGGGGFPNLFEYNFQLETDTPIDLDSSGTFSGAVLNLTIDDIGTPGTDIDLSNVNLTVTKVDDLTTLVDPSTGTSFVEFFENIPNNPELTSTQGFIYQVKLDDVGINPINTSFGDITFKTAGFIVPKELLTPDIIPLESLNSLDKLIDLPKDLPEEEKYQFPLYQVYSSIDENGDGIPDIEAQGLIADLDAAVPSGIKFSLVTRPESVPEASTSVSLLALGILGIGAILKRKQQNNPLN